MADTQDSGPRPFVSKAKDGTLIFSNIGTEYHEAQDGTVRPALSRMVISPTMTERLNELLAHRPEFTDYGFHNPQYLVVTDTTSNPSKILSGYIQRDEMGEKAVFPHVIDLSYRNTAEVQIQVLAKPVEIEPSLHNGQMRVILGERDIENVLATVQPENPMQAALEQYRSGARGRDYEQDGQARPGTSPQAAKIPEKTL